MRSFVQRWWWGGWIACAALATLSPAVADSLDGLAAQIATDQRTGQESFDPLPNPSSEPPGVAETSAAPVAATPEVGAVADRLVIPVVIHRQGGPSDGQAVAADLVRRGSEALHAGTAGRAAHLLAAAVHLDPANGRGHANLGAAYLRLGESERAVAELETAVALVPDLAPAWSNLGLAEARLGHTTAARTHLRQAAALDPDAAAPLVNLARLQAVHGEREASLLTLRRALTRSVVPPQAHLQLALLLEESGRRAEAATHLELYLATAAPHDPELTGRLRTHLAALRGEETAPPAEPAPPIGLASGDE